MLHSARNFKAKLYNKGVKKKSPFERPFDRIYLKIVSKSLRLSLNRHIRF